MRGGLSRDVASRAAAEPFARWATRQRRSALRDGAFKVVVTEQVQRYAVTRTVASWHGSNADRDSRSRNVKESGKSAPSRRTSKSAGASTRRTPVAEPIDPPRHPTARQRRSALRSAANHELRRKQARQAGWNLCEEAKPADSDEFRDAVELDSPRDQPAVDATATEVALPKSPADAAVALSPLSPASGGKRRLSPPPDAGEWPRLPKRNTGREGRTSPTPSQTSAGATYCELCGADEIHPELGGPNHRTSCRRYAKPGGAKYGALKCFADQCRRTEAAKAAKAGGNVP